MVAARGVLSTCVRPREEDIISTIEAFIKRHPLLTYYTLAFAISWGGMLLVIGGPGGLPGTPEQADRLMGIAFSLMAGPSVAGLLLTGLVSGRAGLRDLLARLLRWRVGARWYVVALLTTPLLSTTVFFALSRRSSEFLPPMVTTDDKASLLLPAIAAGLGGGFLEELGWTGFAIPTLKQRHGVFATGLIAGVLWGAWHFLVNFWYSGAIRAGLPPALFLTLYFLTGVAQLTAYRVLMVWVYDRTESLLVATLMHASLIVSTTPMLIPAATGVAFLTWFLALAAALWVVVAAVAMANGGQLSRQQARTRLA
jgi:membrane protease YdiL (CAAX protease family)